jgi:hypothetical protein
MASLQTSTVDAVKALKDYVQSSIDEGLYVAVISLDIREAFDSAWWPAILASLRQISCPGNLYRPSGRYFKDRTAIMSMNNSVTHKQRLPTGLSNRSGILEHFIQHITEFKVRKKHQIAYADDLVILVKGSNPVQIEKYANIETQMVAKWARDNKIRFNEQKSKVMIITKKRPRNRREIKSFLNNKILQQTDMMNYLGITIDRRLNFNQHIDKITGKNIKIVHALSRSAKINWGLRHDVLRIYRGNSPYTTIRGTGMDRVPKEKTQRYKT